MFVSNSVAIRVVKGKPEHKRQTVKRLRGVIDYHKDISMVSRVGPLEESVVEGFYGGLVYGY